MSMTTNTQPTPEKKFEESDLDMLRYFWGDHEDLARYTGWEELVPILERDYPEIIGAWRSYITAKYTLSAVLNGVIIRD
jgi:hypothetical protein